MIFASDVYINAAFTSPPCLEIAELRNFTSWDALETMPGE